MEVLAAEYGNMLRCIRCAACLTSCPTYVVTHKEEEGPRGRIAIMRAMVEGHLDVTPDGVIHLDNCLLCEACTNVCPSGVEMERMGIAFRDVIARETFELRRLVGHDRSSRDREREVRTSSADAGCGTREVGTRTGGLR